MSTLSLEHIEAGLADTQTSRVVTTLCDQCSSSFVATVIPLPPKQCLQSDYVPTTLDFSQIQSDYREEIRQLKEFNDEISRLLTVLGHLSEAKIRLEERIFRRKAVLSAARRVPAEIWRMVFTCVGASSEYSLEFMDHEVSCSARPPIMISIPHTLSRVCKHWKRIVDSIPMLWSSMQIRFSKLQTDIQPVLIEYLEKSRTNPLRISFVDQNPNPPRRAGFPMFPHHQHLTPIQEQCFIHLVTRMAARCEELEFRFPYHIRDPPENIELPLLRSFYSNILPHQLENTRWLWNNVRRAPHLMHLSLHYLPDFPEVSTQSLLSLEIEDVPNGSTFLTLLQGCHNLESLVVKDIYFDQDNYVIQNIGTIHLPHLRQLSLGTEEEPQILAFFFDVLTAPYLVEVKLDFNVVPGENDIDLHGIIEIPFPQDSLTGMLKRHSSSLRKLTLTFHRDDEELALINFSWSGILQVLPALTHLNFFADLFDLNSNLTEIQTLVSSLQCLASPSSSGDVLVPRLEEVVIRLGEACRPAREQFGALWKVMIDSAESRSSAHLSDEANMTPLKKLCVTWTDEEDSFYGSRDGKKSWSSLVIDQTLSERAKALELDGTTCFFGDWLEFSSRFGDKNLSCY